MCPFLFFISLFALFFLNIVSCQEYSAVYIAFHRIMEVPLLRVLAWSLGGPTTYFYLCVLSRHPVHKPSRSWLEPPRIQLD